MVSYTNFGAPKFKKIWKTHAHMQKNQHMNIYLVNFPKINKYFRNKIKNGFKTCFYLIDSLIFFFSLRQLKQFSPPSDWLQSPVMRQQGFQFFSSQSDKVKNMKDTLNQSLVWTVSVWITAEQSGKYKRLAAIRISDWYLKWLWNSAAAMQTDVHGFSQ